MCQTVECEECERCQTLECNRYAECVIFETRECVRLCCVRECVML